MKEYEDILHRERPYSKRKKMSMHDRAAQFAPFAALVGYDAQIDEAARLVEERVLLDEESYRMLDIRMDLLREHLNEEPAVSVLYFVRDLKKAGGAYLTKTGAVRKIDNDRRLLCFTDGEEISIDDIFSLTLPQDLEEKCQ